MTTPFFATRGSRILTEDEFRSHLALAIRLENVAVLLGAGASKAVGGHVMADIWNNYSSTSTGSVEWLQRNGFVDPAEPVNVELLLDRLEIAAEDLRRRSDVAALAELQQHRHELRKCILRAALLDSALWLSPSKVLDEPLFKNHLRLVSRLIGNRQPGQAAPWLFTTNYDLALEWSAEALGVHCVNGFAGLHNRIFRPSSFDLGFRNLQGRGEARFGAYNIYLGKLHGSLCWTTESDGSVVEAQSAMMWPKIEHFLNSSTPSDWPGLMIFPGAAKFVQTTGFVYGEIIRRFTEFLAKPNACLITAGYGFGDDHINRLIASALQNPTLQVIFYVPEVDRFGIYSSLGSTGAPITPNLLLRRLLGAELPQLTVRGYGAGAFFDQLAIDLPEPAILDEAAERARSIEQLLRSGPSHAPTSPATGSPMPSPASGTSPP